MKLFRKNKSLSPERQERLMGLIVTVCENSPTASPESAAAFEAAVVGLREEGEAAEAYMLTVASKGVPPSYEVNLWSAIYDVCGDAVVPAVEHVLEAGVVPARRQAALMLGAIADTSPDARERCLTALREALEREEDEDVLDVIEGLLVQDASLDEAAQPAEELSAEGESEDDDRA